MVDLTALLRLVQIIVQMKFASPWLDNRDVSFLRRERLVVDASCQISSHQDAPSPTLNTRPRLQVDSLRPHA